MEDFVTLSLEKYNELYEKAKAYDEIEAERNAEATMDFIKNFPNKLKEIFGEKKENNDLEKEGK